MPKKDYNTIPSHFAVCLHSDCTVANICLRLSAYNEFIKAREHFQLINPTKCTKDNCCKYFRSNAPEIYARGFTNFQEKMYPSQYNTFKNILITQFSRNCFYERRRGDYAIPPNEQQVILEAVNQAGITQEIKFDSYEERINWYD